MLHDVEEFSYFKMKDFSSNGTVNMVYNDSVLGLEEYDSDEALAAVSLFAGYPEGLLKFASVCCGLFMVIGIPGNLITIVALARCKKVRNATAIFIINLSLSDLLFCVFNLPLAASTFWKHSWVHGKFLCRMFPFARYALLGVSLFTVLAITINRYILISRPTLYTKLYTKRWMGVMIASIWMFCFGSLIATWMEEWGRFSLNPLTGSCTIIPDVNGRSPKKYMFIGGFLIPGLAVLVFYIRIFCIVKKVGRKSRPTIRLRPKSDILSRESTHTNNESVAGKKSYHISFPSQHCNNPFTCLAIPEISSTSGMDAVSEEREKKMTEGDKFFSRSNEALQKLKIALTPAPRQPKPQKLLPSKKDRKLRTMIMAIMISFCLCHLPISVIKIFLEVKTHAVVQIISYILLYLTTCINPIVYVVMSNEYRQAYKNLITCKRSDQDFPESTVLRRIASMKTMSAIRHSVRKLHSVNTQQTPA